MSQSKFNPFTPDFRAKPYGWYQDLLEESPGRIVVDGVDAIYVARPEHIAAVTKDPNRFGNAKPKRPGMEKIDFFNGMPTVPYVDPPEHTRLRRMVMPGFAPAALKSFHAAAEEWLVEQVAALPAGETVDLVASLTTLASRELVLGIFLDVPREDWHIFLAITHAQGLLARTPAGGEKPKEFVQAWDDGLDYCRDLIKNPAKLSEGSLARGLVENESMSPDELLAMLLLLFTAGLNTVNSHLASGLYLMATHPEELRKLSENPELAAQATEEVLRYDAPNLVTWRFVREDTEAFGMPLPKDTPVYILNGAANFDAERYEDPFAFDIARKKKGHLAFGEGIHFCLGAPMARTASQVVLREIARRFPNMKLADPNFEPAYEGTPTVRNMIELPVVLLP